MELRIFPALTTAVTRRGYVGPTMAWVFARALDVVGTGWVGEAEFREAALKIWSPSKYRRYRREALAMGLLTLQTTKDGRRLLFITGLRAGCEILGITDPGYAPVLVDEGCLRSASAFKAACLAAFHTAGRGRSANNPISRETLQELTGVGKKTQRVYEVKNNERGDGQVTATPSFLLTGLSPDHLQWARDCLHPACYVYDNQVVRPLPNTYQSTCAVASASGLRKVRKQLQRNLLNKSHGGRCNRVFFDQSEAERAEKAMRQPDRPGQTAALSKTPVAILKVRNAHRGRNVYAVVGTQPLNIFSKNKER